MIDILLENTGTQVKNFLSALVKGLQTNSDAMETFNNDLVTRSKYNGQKMVMQKALNEIFGQAVNYIKIDYNRSVAIGIFFYNSAEASPNFFFNSAESQPRYFLNLGEFTSIYDFTVQVPNAYYIGTGNVRRITAEVNKIKVLGKKFNVVSV